MKEADTDTGGSRRTFPTTLWQDILKAGDPTDPESRECLQALLQLYWKPIFCYVRAAWPRLSIEEAKDLTQSFCVYLLEKNLLGQAREEKGSFRGFLKVALTRFVIDAQRRSHAQVRSPKHGWVSVDASREELESLGPASQDEEPGRALDRQWVQTVLDEALAQLRRQLAGEGRSLHYEVFALYCLSGQGLTYGEVAKRLGISTSRVRNYLSGCRKSLRQILWQRIGNYVMSPEQAEQELRDILGQ